MNIVFIFIAGMLAWLNKKYIKNHGMKMMKMEGGGKIKKVAVSIFIFINMVGLSVFAYTQFQ
jgi:hypothetical protein